MPETIGSLIRYTREELEIHRGKILSECRFSYEELRERVCRSQVTMDELMVWHTIEGIDYLLEGD